MSRSYDDIIHSVSDLTQTLKAGTFLIIERGAWSDFTYDGPVRVVRDFVKGEVAEKFKKEYVQDDNNTGEDAFLGWLVKNGYVEAVDDCHSWHVGSYGSFDP